MSAIAQSQISIRTPYIKDLACFIAGCLLPFAFAPFGYFELAILCPAVLLFSNLDVVPKRGLWRGFVFGLGFFGVGASWIYNSIQVYGNAPVPLAILLTFLFVLVLVVYPAFMMWLLATIWSPTHKIARALAFPILWVLLECLRSILWTGFPWLLVAHSQMASPLAGFIPLVGEIGVGFLTVSLSSLLVLSLIDQNVARKSAYGLCALTILISGFALNTHAWTKVEKTIKVSLIQGNIAQQIKWQPEELAGIISRHMQLTQNNNAWKSSLIVWPENAMPVPLQEIGVLRNLLTKEAIKHGATLISGVPMYTPDQKHYYNALVALGVGKGTYIKRNLVPFGEYVPLEQWLRGVITFFNLPMSDVQSGPKQQSLLQFQNIYLASLICYEIAYETLLLPELPQANLLVTVTDDSWFGRSFAAAQHLQIGQFRAKESGRSLLFATNNGITAVIKPTGEIQKQLPKFTESVLTDEVVIMSGATPWQQLGRLPLIILLSIMLAILWVVTLRSMD